MSDSIRSDVDRVRASNPDRRKFLGLTAALSGALAGCSKSPEGEEEPSRLGKPVSAYGERSTFETASRKSRDTPTPEASSSLTPLQDSYGIITPSSLHFERHHSGVPAIDPAQHKLLIHGMVERPTMFTLAELKRLPSVSRIHFVECSGNGRSEWGPNFAPSPQMSHGLASCSEWTGVQLSMLLNELGVKPGASWIIAEGGDPCNLQRSLPIAKAMDDVLLVYGQNGEGLRPENGYPLRLLVPGYEGNINIKWLRRLMLTDQAAMAKDETSKYTDLMPDGKARQFTLVMEAKSVITSPSGGQKLSGKGFQEITGLAWSGRGRIEKVEVSVDGGSTWQAAEVQEPRYTRAFTRFRLPWTWDGSETVIASRCTDESGYVQPPNEDLLAARGKNSDYHNNAIKSWKIAADGSVNNV